MTPSPNRIALAGLLTSIALIFSYIEVLIPFNMGIPGVKLGIANLVIIISLYYLNGRYALAVNLLRIFISGFLFSGVFGIIYSLAGGLLSLLCMVLLKKTNLFSVTGVSMAGGVVHNLGQMIIAAVLVGNVKVFVYFPVLVFSGVASGFIIGILAFLILKRLPSKPL
ncbi:MAG: Gx transporter family protein [Clostridiales bacterium]|nr:Gx transporter family protein [Clostridiales bacterium]MDD7034946.1 Gx transporter family protein [Bacillota bacterium]MDY2920293.1 Gx transporter family protein [Lentihominibacter sp.]